MKKKKISKIGGIVLAVILTLFIWNIYDINTVDINKYNLYSTKLPRSFDGYKIAFISDYHNADFYNQVVQKINSQKPDVILLGGDMVTIGEANYSNTLELLKAIKDIAPIYMVTGNHEMAHDDLEKIKNDFTALGVQILNNKKIKLEKDNNSINLYGMKDSGASDSSLKDSKYMKQGYDGAASAYDAGTYNIMLMHRANAFDIVYDLGYDAVLAGHLHGGLIRLPVLGGVVSTQRNLWFPPYTKGIYFMGQSKMIVSAGADKSKLKPRVFNSPELVMVTLNKG